MKLKTNLEKTAPPVGEYKLPSSGLFYKLGDGKIFPPTIKVKPYGFITEAILVTTLTSSEKMVGIIKDVAELPEGFDPFDMFVADQHMILAIARSLTYGERYSFSSTCPSCGFEEKHSLKVPDEIPVKIWTDNAEQAKTPGYVHTKNFTFRLTECKDTVELKFPTIKDNERANKYGEEKKKIITSYEPSYIRRLAIHIKSVNGEEVGPNDLDQLENEFILKLRGPDMVELKKKIDDNSCGIIQNWDIQCNKCSEAYKTFIPILSSFFR